MQFYHIRTSIDATLCAQIPDKDWLEMFFTAHGSQTILPVGLTVKSPVDQFNKKLGREAALKKVNQVLFEFEKVFTRGARHFYVFTGSVTHNRTTYKTKIHLSTIKESNNVFLTFAELREASSSF